VIYHGFYQHSLPSLTHQLMRAAGGTQKRAVAALTLTSWSNFRRWNSRFLASIESGALPIARAN